MADSERIRPSEREAQRKELLWAGTTLDIAIQPEALKDREWFVKVINAGREAHIQCMELKNELHQYRAKSEKKIRELGEELNKTRGKNVEPGGAWPRDETPVPARKRQRRETPGQEEYDPKGSPSSKRVRVKPSDRISREQIRGVLGGADRGWGAIRACPSKGGIVYTHFLRLDVGSHLFGQRPRRKRDVNEAVLGFGPEDNEAISEGPILPLFVCEMEKSPYIYLGNYIAKRLDPVAWESLSTEGKKCAVKTVKYKGFSTYGSPLKNEQRMSEEDIHHQFDDGNFKVPCSGLKFQGFDEDLEIAIRKSLGRTRLR